MAGLLSIRVPFRDMPDVQAALDCFTILAAYDIRRHQLPPVYKAGVRYRREKCVDVECSQRFEDWQVPSVVMQLGWGDCEDLAAWRAAELRLQGEKARAVPRSVRPGLVHIVVRRGNGKIEDPSRILGMGKKDVA